MTVSSEVPTSAVTFSTIWFPIPEVAQQLALPPEDVRILAETFLNLDQYDPYLDMLSEQGRQQIPDLPQD